MNSAFKISRTFKITLLWILFAFAGIGTYLLSHKIESRGNTAAAFLSSGTTKQIEIFSNFADPLSVQAFPGDEILFVVRDDSLHNISEERTNHRDARIESGQIGKDESYSLVFDRPGLYSFYDRMHQDIHITVEIK